MSELRLYDYAPSCNCYKARLLLAQLGVDYERTPVDIFAGETLTEAFGQINPARTTPVLRTADGEHLGDSSAILVYLADGTPLMPAGAFARADAIRWLIYEQTEVIPAIGGLRFRLQTRRLRPEDPEAIARRAAGVEVLGVLDAHLRAHPFFVGDAYSIADIAIYAYTHLAGEAGFELDALTGLTAWLDRVAAQPGYVEDVAPYPANAVPGAGASIYDPPG